MLDNLIVIVEIRDAPDIKLAGYPANLKAGYRISGFWCPKFNWLVKKEINEKFRCKKVSSSHP
jgi:hypothetical protein